MVSVKGEDILYAIASANEKDIDVASTNINTATAPEHAVKLAVKQDRNNSKRCTKCK